MHRSFILHQILGLVWYLPLKPPLDWVEDEKFVWLPFLHFDGSIVFFLSPVDKKICSFVYSLSTRKHQSRVASHAETSLSLPIFFSLVSSFGWKNTSICIYIYIYIYAVKDKSTIVGLSYLKKFLFYIHFSCSL